MRAPQANSAAYTGCMHIDRALLNASRRSWLDSSGPRAGPYWLQWVWTLLFCAVLAVGFTVLGFIAFARDSTGAWRNLAGWAEWYGRNLIVCLTIGSLIHITFELLGLMMGGQLRDLRRVHGWPAWQRTLFFSGIPVLCTFVGWPLGVWLAGANLSSWVGQPRGQNLIAGTVLLSLLLTFVFHQFFAIKARQITAEKRAAEAQLRLLQGQIEPHFLFNTLANVISLIDHDPPRAKHMLESFTDYLRSSLTSLRHDQATLGSEMALAHAYLCLLKVRMDDRLQFDIDIDNDPALRDAKLPPLLLQPLVENAIHHGLEPKLEGGRVQVRAHLEDQTLVLQVSDDGMGLAAPARRRGAGMALNNLRERLLAQYGGQASLTLTAASPGTVATVRLPIQRAVPT